MNMRLAGIDPSLYFVTDSKQCAQAGRSVAATAAAAVAGGAGIVQVRDKTLDDAGFYHLVRRVLAVVQPIARDEQRRVPVVLNDRVAVAQRLLEEGEDVHIHVGQNDTAVDAVRQRLGAVPLLGLSAASADEFAAARASHCVDLVGVGPAFTTTTKADAPPALGVDKLTALAAAAGLPAVAIGGIDAERAGQLRDSGIIGVCVVSAICRSADPRAAAATIHAAFRSAG